MGDMWSSARAALDPRICIGEPLTGPAVPSGSPRRRTTSTLTVSHPMEHAWCSLRILLASRDSTFACSCSAATARRIRFWSASSMRRTGRSPPMAVGSPTSQRRPVSTKSTYGRSRMWTTGGGRSQPVGGQGRCGRRTETSSSISLSGGELIAVPVQTRPTFSAGRPVLVLKRQYSVGGSSGPSYDIAPDGQRFLMIKADDSAQPPKLVLVQNWFEELKARVPTGQ